jgi:hypothetical protein
MDPRGRWAAFSPCCRKEFPTLVAARVRGGTVLQPLADHSKIYFVLGTVRNTVIGEALAWTRDGILYSDYRNLRSAKAGVASRHETGPFCAHLQRRRAHRSPSATSGPDDTDHRRVIGPFADGEDTTDDVVTPSFDGSTVLAERSPPGDVGRSDVVTWSTDASPTLRPSSTSCAAATSSRGTSSPL